MKNFLKWLLGYEEPKSTTSDPEREYNREPVDENNYRHYLPTLGFLLSEAKVDIVKSLSDEQVRSLLVDALCWNYFSIEICDLRPTKAMRIALREKLYHYIRKNKEQKKLDDAVAAALAKRDAKDTTGGESVVSGTDHRTSIIKRIEYTPAFEHAQKLCDELHASRAQMFGSFLGVSIPSEASIEKCRQWLYNCFNSLYRLDNEHPVIKAVKAEMDQVYKDIADKKKIEGVVTELVRPTSLLKRKPPTKPSTSKSK